MLRKLFMAVPVTLLVVGGTTACATKKFVKGEVDTVNGKVETLSQSLEATQQQTKENAGRITQVDQKADQLTDQFVHQAMLIEPRMARPYRADDPARQRHGGNVVERKQFGAQSIVDIVGVIGDVVGDGGDLGLNAGEAPELKILQF